MRLIRIYCPRYPGRRVPGKAGVYPIRKDCAAWRFATSYIDSKTCSIYNFQLARFYRQVSCVRCDRGGCGRAWDLPPRFEHGPNGKQFGSAGNAG